MGGEGTGRPPSVLRWFLRVVLPSRERDPVAVEMEELYRARRARQGPIRAGAWFARAVAGFAVRLGALRGATWGRDLAADVRYGVRVLARRPTYTVTAVVTLGLGAGGLASVHAVADWVLLRPVPGVSEPEGLITLRKGSTDSDAVSWPVSHTDLEALRARIGALTALEARTPMDVNLSFEEGVPPLRVRAAAVTGAWFETVGVRMAAGRPPASAPDPALAGRGEVVVAWEVASSMAPRPVEALGRTVHLDGVPHRVVGVTGRGFRGAELPGGTLAWLGSAALVDLVPGASAERFRRGWSESWELAVGRLAPGASVADVEAEALRVMEELRASEGAHTFFVDHFTLQAFPGVGLEPSLRGPVRRTVGLLAGGATFLLLLAGLNVANLTLTHAASRSTATTVRRALGAGRGRLARQVLAEHAVLGLLGAGAALAVAALGLHFFRGVRLEEFGATLEGVRPGAGVLAVLMGLSLATALAAGLGAALAGGREHQLGRLRGAAAGSRTGRRIRAVLAAAQVALSAVLVVGAGLMARTVANLRALDPGFAPDGVLAFTVDPARMGDDPARVVALLDRLSAELEAEPGVRAAGFVFPEPLQTSFYTSWLRPPGADEDEGLLGAHLQVSGRFLEAMGVELIAGRYPGEEAVPRAGGTGVVVVTRSSARTLFPGRSPSEVVGALAGRPRDEPPVRIVGVVGDLRLTGPRQDPPPVFVVPWNQGAQGQVAVGWVRVRSGAPEALSGAVRRAVRRVDTALPVYDVRTVREQADRMVADQRVLAGLVTAVSVLGLVLAAVGLHGVLAYAVTERWREIGIRTALGADRGKVLRRVLSGGIGIALGGLVTGLAGAATLTRVVESRLYGVEPLDPLTYGLGSALLLAVAVLASWIPARRATRVPVVQVLRAEA